MTILVASQCNMPVHEVNMKFNGYAVDFRMNNIYYEIKPGNPYLGGTNNMEKSLKKILNQLLIEQQNTGLNEKKIGIVLECSNLPFDKVLKFREFINSRNLGDKIILTHKNEALIIKSVIKENSVLLVQNDYILQNISKQGELSCDRNLNSKEITVFKFKL